VIGVDNYKDIRHLSAVEGLSQREIAKRLGISRKTAKHYCLGAGGCIAGELRGIGGYPGQAASSLTGGHYPVLSH
jgi:hypothetical protein